MQHLEDPGNAADDRFFPVGEEEGDEADHLGAPVELGERSCGGVKRRHGGWFRACTRGLCVRRR
jgi:hypothetical protein